MDICGWMSDRELLWLSDRAKKCDLIIEIGTWLGRSAYAMGETVLGKVITIDNFSLEEILSKIPKADRKISWAIKMDNREEDWLYHQCLANLDSLIKVGKVEVIRGNSSEAIKDLQSLKADMVFIDGCHEYESVKEDIINYMSLVKKGGMICGHDFAGEVKQAVLEILPKARVVRKTSIWYCGL